MRSTRTWTWMAGAMALIAMAPVVAGAQEAPKWSDVDCAQSHIVGPTGLKCRATQVYSGGTKATSNAGGQTQHWSMVGTVNGAKLTSSAGGNDDSACKLHKPQDFANCGNGELITCSRVKPLPRTRCIESNTKESERRATLRLRCPAMIPPIREENGGNFQMASLISSHVKPCQVRRKCPREY